MGPQAFSLWRWRFGFARRRRRSVRVRLACSGGLPAAQIGLQRGGEPGCAVVGLGRGLGGHVRALRWSCDAGDISSRVPVWEAAHGRCGFTRRCGVDGRALCHTRAMRVLGVILAGGEGSRLGGVDKAHETIAGRTCLDRVVERLAPQADALALVAGGPAGDYAGFRGAILRDAGWPVREGPMAGVLAGLLAARDGRFDAVLTVAVDTPFFPSDLRRRLAADIRPGAVAIAASAGRAHPVFGLWPAALADPALSFFDAGGRSPDRFSREVGRLLVGWEPRPFDPFANLNTPEDRAALEAIAASLAP